MNYSEANLKSSLDAFNEHKAMIADVRATLEPLLEAHAPECQGILNEIAIVAGTLKWHFERGWPHDHVREVSAIVSDTKKRKVLDKARKKIAELTEILENLDPFHLHELENNLGEPYAFSHRSGAEKPPGIVASLERLDLALRDTAESAKAIPTRSRPLNPETPFRNAMWQLLEKHGVNPSAAAAFIAAAAVALKFVRDNPGLERSILSSLSQKTAAPSPQQ
jgi:hypothetical protein